MPFFVSDGYEFTSSVEEFLSQDQATFSCAGRILALETLAFKL